jgi:signal transduction histidine kinase
MSSLPNEAERSSNRGLSPAAFARALLEAGGFKAIVDALEGLARARLHAVRIALFWSTKSGAVAQHRLRCVPRSARVWASPALALESLAARAPRQSATNADGRQLRSWPLDAGGSGSAIIQIEGSPTDLTAIESDPALNEGLALLARRVAGALEARRLKLSVRRFEKAERLQRALYAIADLASSEEEQPEVMRQMHRIVGSLMYAENFFIVLYDAGRKTLRFVYFADSKDTDVPDPDEDLDEGDVANSLTLALLHLGKPLLGSSAEISRRLGIPSDASDGPDSEAWLGVPMIAEGEVRGAIVVQSYDKAVRYHASDLALLSYVARHILVTLTRRHAREELERQVQVRTNELAQANQELTVEVHERKAAERLQAALFRIAELTNTTPNINEFYAAVHAVIGQLLYARNFFVALLVDNDGAFDFPYAADECDPTSMFQRRELRRGLSEYVVRSGKPLLLDHASVDRLVKSGEVVPIGTFSVGWLGVPLIMNGRTAGVLVVQSYTEGVGYTVRDQELLTFVALHVATALQRRQAQESLRAAYTELQGRIEELRRTQAELIENEKMASLGRLVAGVAHEINTPLGIGVTAASHLDAIFASIDRMQGDAAQADLHAALTSGRRCAELVLINLGKADHLVKTFKQVAVDQSNEVRRRIAVRPYLDEVLASLHPRLKATPHRVEVDCPADIEIDTFPGALYQIVANLVLNSLMHAFDNSRAGHIRITVSFARDVLELTFADDGKGMPEEVRQRVFEPFFTTRRGSGGTGLGLHLVYNLVTQLLRGMIVCTSSPGKGTQFTIRLPPVVTGSAEPAAIYDATASRPTAA